MKRFNLSRFKKKQPQRSITTPVADYTNPNSKVYQSVSKLLMEALNERGVKVNGESKFNFIKIAEKSNVTCVGAFVIYSHMSKFIDKNHQGKWIIKSSPLNNQSV